MTDETVCEHCGAKIVEYKHGMSRGLARGLYKLAKSGRNKINLNELNMSISQQTNFYKLKYWGLVRKAIPENERGGEWIITQEGWDFICGKTTISHHVWTFRGQVVRFEGDKLGIEQITDGWKYRPQYAREAIRHDPTDQPPLL